MKIIRNILIIFLMLSIKDCIGAEFLEIQIFKHKEADSKIVEAVLAYPNMKKLKNYPEKWTLKKIKKTFGMEQKTTKMIIMTAYPLLSGKISTENVKFRWKIVKDMELKPDFSHNFRNKESSGALNYNWSFR